MSEPLISVVIPVRDGERYLAEAIESVLAQTRGRHEVIIVLDGSSDRSDEIAAGFGDPVRVISQRPAGIPAARNRGVALAEGDLISFLDHDDLWDREMTAARLERFEADPELGIARTGAQNFLSPDLPPERAATLRYATGLIEGELAGGTLMRRQVWTRVGEFNDELRAGEFLEWMLRARRLGVRESMVSRPLLRRRVHASNTTLRAGAEGLRDYTKVLKAELDARRAAR